MRHIIRPGPTLTHIFPRTMKVMPANIFLSSNSTWPPRASLTRFSRASSGGTVFLHSRDFQAARRNRFQSDQTKCFANQCLQLLIIHFGKLYAHPAARPNVGRPEVNFGRLFNQTGLHACSSREPHGSSAVAVVTVRKHGENPLRGEKGWLTVRELFNRAGN